MSPSNQDRKKHRGNGSDYQRRSASRRPRKSFLIVVEGETEELYFKKYADDSRSRLIDIFVDNPPCTDPINLVKRAMELKQQKERDAKRSEISVPYDEIWIVYDLERVHDERRKLSNDAGQMAKSKKIQIARSDPAFEYWYILHFKQTTKSFNDAAETERYLKRFWPDYRKATTPRKNIYEKTQAAIGNAQWVREQLEKSRSKAPKTDVDILVEELIENICDRE